MKIKIVVKRPDPQVEGSDELTLADGEELYAVLPHGSGVAVVLVVDEPSDTRPDPL